ncbi:alkaline phosphatase family protein [Sulfurisphaera ohwakuensis]|uniref:alkaline phosphatase family protein n=1 Tax=Sulfurisphaera ohwakuensis TaxID=69656 RepID=UPI0036F1DF6B
MKVLLIIIDGASYKIIEKIKDKLPTINKLINSGFYGKLESVFPSLTPIALASLITGNLPEHNGITAPKIFIKGRSLSSPLSAFSSEGLKSDPIWAYLGKHGYKVTVTSNPQALPDKWKIKDVILFDPYKSKIKKCSDAKVLSEGENKILSNIWLVEKRNSKYLIVYTSPYGEKEIELEEGEWSEPIEILGKCGKDELKGTVFLHARHENVYVSPISFFNYKWGNNTELQEKIWNFIVNKHGMILDGDYHSLYKGIITLDEYLKTIELTYSFFLNYTLFMLENTNWDFAITYLPIVDNLQHLLYGINEEKAFEHIVKGYEMADEFIRAQLNYADVFFVCSDHGIAEVEKKIFINKFLEKINVLKLNDNEEIDWSKTKAYYGGGGQIRINLKNREKNGIVSHREFPKLVRYIVRNLENLVDEEKNERIFTSIVARESPANDREGDIYITGLKEKYGISSLVKKDMNIIEKIEYYKMTSGEHGYFRKDDLYGIIIFYDKKSNTRRKFISNAKIIDVAPTILKLFNVTNVKMDGKPIITLVEKYGDLNNY